MASAPVTENGKDTQIKASDLFAAVSYMPDVTVTGNSFHSWRVGLVSRRVAAILTPDTQCSVFYAGLFADLGAVGADMHISRYVSARQQMRDRHIATHPIRTAALLDWLPGMEIAAKYVRSHHEWWDGSGYPAHQVGNQIPLASQIVGIVDAADLSGCFSGAMGVRERVQALAPLVGRAWSKQVWKALETVVSDADFCMTITDEVGLPSMIASDIEEACVPERLDTEEGIERLLHMMAVLVDFKDPSTREHSIRTARFAKVLALELGLDEGEAQHCYRAGLVHDIGRMGVPTSLLVQQRPLKDDEMRVVRKHAEIGIRILNCLPNRPAMAEFARVAGHDHERWDGTGYPSGLAGKNIPLTSRIISVADAFDAVTNPPSYRLPLSSRAAYARLKVEERAQFDPEVIEALRSAISHGAIEIALQSAA